MYTYSSPAFRRPYAVFQAIAVVCLFTTVAGCQTSKRQAQNADAPNQASGTSTGLQRVSQTLGGLQSATLRDPVLGMDGSEIQVPAGWHVQGQVGTSPCTTMASSDWQSASADGQSQVIVLPLVGWRWGKGAQFSNGCIPLHGSMRATDFLQQFIGRLHGVHVLGEMPVPDTYRQREVSYTARLNSNNGNLMPQLRTQTVGDVAAVHATDNSGEEMRLRAWTECSEGMDGGKCFARIDILRAPKDHLNSLVSLVDSHNLVQEHPTQQWQAAYAQNQQHVAAGQMDILRHNADAGNKMLHDQYVSSSERLRQEHEAGMEELQRSTDSSMRNANNSMNARSTAASDMRDYAADQQTVSGANGTYKTSSQFSNVWSSPYGPALSDGRTFGSTDNTIDPNTSTDNTFTKDKKVHGNGQPY